MSEGIERFRQAIKDQRDFGSGEFCLTYGAAEKIAAEIEDELARFAWAKGVPAPVDADGEVVPLDTTELYMDDGEIVYVNNIRFNGCTWFVGDEYSYKLYQLNKLHLAGQDSWELLEKSILTLAKCKFLTDPEGDVKECIRRAKAIAERDTKEADRD